MKIRKRARAAPGKSIRHQNRRDRFPEYAALVNAGKLGPFVINDHGLPDYRKGAKYLHSSRRTVCHP